MLYEVITVKLLGDGGEGVPLADLIADHVLAVALVGIAHGQLLARLDGRLLLQLVPAPQLPLGHLIGAADAPQALPRLDRMQPSAVTGGETVQLPLQLQS